MMSILTLILALLCLGAILLLLAIAVVLWLQNRQEEQVGQAPVASHYSPGQRPSAVPVPSGLQADAGLYEAVKELLSQGRKIEAIKLYREMTGVGLKEAKDAIDVTEREIK